MAKSWLMALVRASIAERLLEPSCFGPNRALMVRQAIRNIGYHAHAVIMRASADKLRQPDFVADYDSHCGGDREWNFLRRIIHEDHHSSGSEIEDARLEYSSRRIVYHCAGLHGFLGSTSKHFTYSLFAASGTFFAALEDELRGYELRKGTVHFPLTKPVPVKLIGRIAKLRAAGIVATVKKPLLAGGTGRRK